jgi:hypothetical protein
MQHQAAQQQGTAPDFPIYMVQLANAQQQDEHMQVIIRRIQSLTKNPAHHNYALINHVLHQLSLEHPPRPFIPGRLTHKFLSFYHDHPLSGHMGFHKVL